MTRNGILAVALFGVVAGTGTAGETIGVEGSKNSYSVYIEANLGNKKHKMRATGAALRKKIGGLFSVYTIGSYIQDDMVVRTAEELAAADCVKQLHLILERSVSGKDMASAFHDAIRANYPTGFEAELQQFKGAMESASVEKGDQVWLTHVPGYGIHVNLVGKTQQFIKNPNFSKAVWEIYLGRKPIAEEIKAALSSRLQ